MHEGGARGGFTLLISLRGDFGFRARGAGRVGSLVVGSGNRIRCNTVRNRPGVLLLAVDLAIEDQLRISATLCASIAPAPVVRLCLL